MLTFGFDYSLSDKERRKNNTKPVYSSSFFSLALLSLIHIHTCLVRSHLMDTHTHTCLRQLFCNTWSNNQHTHVKDEGRHIWSVWARYTCLKYGIFAVHHLSDPPPPPNLLRMAVQNHVWSVWPTHICWEWQFKVIFKQSDPHTHLFRMAVQSHIDQSDPQTHLSRVVRISYLTSLI